MKIMATAQTMTSEMATETCWGRARQAPPMAMAPETPQIEPPAARVAPKRRSSPKSRVAAK